MGGSSDDDGEKREIQRQGRVHQLELGLSLGAKNKKKSRVPACRILTAKDFPGPSRASRASPSPSDSSSVSSSSVWTVNADSSPSPADPCPASPETGCGSGSANPSNQAVVGWPPVSTSRMNSLFNLSKSDPSSDASKKPVNQHSQNTSNTNKHTRKDQAKILASSPFIKVNMDGDPIGRKLDLNSHDSYEGLAFALELMFNGPTSDGANRTRLLDNSSDFVLTYKDKDGDWLLVGDVPWSMFMDTAKRLRIMRNSDANKLASRFQSSSNCVGRIQS